MTSEPPLAPLSRGPLGPLCREHRDCASLEPSSNRDSTAPMAVRIAPVSMSLELADDVDSIESAEQVEPIEREEREATSLTSRHSEHGSLARWIEALDRDEIRSAASLNGLMSCATVPQE
mmetsp:Transcript_15795/g.37648  ORF Transcript_15795/g.37648 Transcript_15795/m.37648 type:complete len:120 (-) Transcript_15795:192-551(-)